jgi:hypothetical protein
MMLPLANQVKNLSFNSLDFLYQIETILLQTLLKNWQNLCTSLPYQQSSMHSL